MQRVHLRPDVLSVMTWQLSAACMDGLCGDQFRQVSYDEGLVILNNQRFLDGAYTQFVTNPVADNLTFGLYTNFMAPTKQ